MIACIRNHLGITFNVRLVRKGERYGLNDKLVHDKVDPLVEFYDATYENDPRFGPRGQFVARYYLSTLNDHPAGSGLALMGHVPNWSLQWPELDAAIRAAVRALCAEPTSTPPR